MQFVNSRQQSQDVDDASRHLVGVVQVGRSIPYDRCEFAGSGLSRRPSCRLWEVSAFSGQLSVRDIADHPLRSVECQRGRAWTEN